AIDTRQCRVGAEVATIGSGLEDPLDRVLENAAVLRLGDTASRFGAPTVAHVPRRDDDDRPVVPLRRPGAEVHEICRAVDPYELALLEHRAVEPDTLD